jgi:hypothetical protein
MELDLSGVMPRHRFFVQGWLVDRRTLVIEPLEKSDLTSENGVCMGY